MLTWARLGVSLLEELIANEFARLTRWGRWGRLLCIGVTACSIVACHGGGPSDAPSAASVRPPGPPPAYGGGPNRAPTIFGIPAVSVKAGTAYSFVPRATDLDHDYLSFQASGLPSWAKFDSRTGRVYGVPGFGDLGDHESIRISVSDGKVTTSLPAYKISVVASANGAATLSWLPPTERSDGTPLQDLAGHNIYWSLSPDFEFPNTTTVFNAGITSYLIEQLTPARWYFAVTAFDADGVESKFSNIASKVIEP